jgi:hypothetical protein
VQRVQITVVVVFAGWVAPTFLLSLLVHNWLPVALGLTAAMCHAGVLLRNATRAEKQRRAEFWAGRAASQELPARSISTELKRTGRG